MTSRVRPFRTTTASPWTRLRLPPASRRRKCPGTTRVQRSLRSSSKTALDRRLVRTGSGSSVGARRAVWTRPDARSAPAPVADEGDVRIATNRPRSVTPIVSPRSTRRSAADARCWSSLTPMVSMCVKCSTWALSSYSVISRRRFATCCAVSSGGMVCSAMSFAMSPSTRIFPAMKACMPTWGLPSTRIALAVT